MAKDNGGASPQVREVGDAPNITRLISADNCKEHVDKEASAGRAVFRSSWSSPEAFATHISKMDPDGSWYDNGYSWSPSVWKKSSEHKEFSGVDNIQEAIDMAFHGWEEGGALIEKTRGYIQALNPLSPKMVKYGIAGTTPNVPRAIAGNLLNMKLPANVASRKKKTITIIYNMCECGMTNQAQISNKAAVTAALIDEIEAKGFSCEVIAVATTSNHQIKVLTSVCVKESHQPVDINRLAFSLGHAAMFRMLFFADWEGDDFCSKLGHGLGWVSTTAAEKEQNLEQIYTIEGGHNGNIPIKLFKDLDTAATKGLNAIVRELQRQGCPAFPKLKDHEDGLDEKPREEDEVPHYSYDEEEDW